MSSPLDGRSAARAADEPPTPDAASARYWKATSGYTYQEIVREREANGAAGYRQQERVLSALLTTEAARRGRPLDVLEVGCGFGRHAAYLAGLDGVRYHGYDFSDAMLEPLRAHPPAGLPAERILGGPSLSVAAGERRFDVLFTVSVLIHNPPERAAALIAEMGRHLAPGGFLCLVENRLVPFGVWENAWHQGCWLHAYPTLAGAGWDLFLGQGLIETHDVYLLRPNGGDAQRVFALAAPERPFEEGTPLSGDALAARGMAKLEEWSRQVAETTTVDAAAPRLFELEEQLRVERARLQRTQRLGRLADELAALRARATPVRPPAVRAPAVRPPSPGVLVDAPLDTAWAHQDPRFGRVAHVFHQEWFGIRGAAGYFPGRKVAISATRPLTPPEMAQAVRACTDGLVRHVFVHSCSPTAAQLIELVRKQVGDGLKIHAVWHGSTAQFHFADELRAFSDVLALRRRRLLDSVLCVKPGMHELSPLVSPLLLLNLPPRVTRRAPRAEAGSLIPLVNDWRKNFLTNLFAAAAVPRLAPIHVTTEYELGPELTLPARVIRLGWAERAQMFRLVERVALLFNATLSECQPMVALEGLALGVPCLTGPLSLGALDAHPYQRLAQVAGMDTVSEVRRAAERLLSVPGDELTALMDDYRSTLERAAFERLGELLQA